MRRTARIQDAPTKPMFICVFIAWGLIILPIPFSSIVAYPLIIASLILAVICFNRDDIKNGVIGLILVFIGTPIAHLITWFLFASTIGSQFALHANKGVPASVRLQQMQNEQRIRRSAIRPEIQLPFQVGQIKSKTQNEQIALEEKTENLNTKIEVNEKTPARRNSTKIYTWINENGQKIYSNHPQR